MLHLTFLLLVVSFLLVLVGMLIMMFSVLRESGSPGGGERKVEGGGILIVGPVPIVFGTSERITKILILLAIALLITAVVSFIILSSGHWRWVSG